MKEDDYNIRAKKISRRKFLNKTSYAAKIAGMGAVYGAVGNIGGKIYETERDALRKIKRGYDEQIDALQGGLEKSKEMYKKEKNHAKNIAEFIKEKIQGDSYNPPRNPQPPQRKKQEEIKQTRRGFLRKTMGFYHEHPVPAFTATGVAYGAGKQAVKSYESYKQQLYKLEDQLTHAKYEQQILDLTKEIKDLRKFIEERFPKESRLEKDVQEEFIALGFAGILISLILTSINITGNVSNLNNSFEKPIISVLIFIISIITIFLGIKKKN